MSVPKVERLIEASQQIADGADNAGALEELRAALQEIQK